MTCRECLEKFSALSADNIAETKVLSIQEHLHACPQCHDEWLLFERTLLLLSTSTQPLPPPETSLQMWRCCAEHVFAAVEKKRLRKRGVLGWFTQQPRWSWASLIGALAILGAAWFFAPHDETLNAINDATNALRNARSAQAGLGPGDLVTFQRPPTAALGLVNHHSAMAADPFADNVGSTLASYSATSPLKASTVKTAVNSAAPLNTPPLSNLPAPPMADSNASTPAVLDAPSDASAPTEPAPVTDSTSTSDSTLPASAPPAVSTNSAPSTPPSAPATR